MPTTYALKDNGDNFVKRDIHTNDGVSLLKFSLSAGTVWDFSRVPALRELFHPMICLINIGVLGYY